MTVHVFSDDDAVRDSLDVLLQANGMAVSTYDRSDALMREVAAKPSGCVLLDVERQGRKPPRNVKPAASG